MTYVSHFHILTICTCFNYGANSSRYEDQQAGELVKQIQENHNGAETSPQYWRKEEQIMTYVTIEDESTEESWCLVKLKLNSATAAEQCVCYYWQLVLPVVINCILMNLYLICHCFH